VGFFADDEPTMNSEGEFVVATWLREGGREIGERGRDMKAAGTILALVVALAIGYFIFKAQFTQGPTGGAPPQQTIDVVGVRSDLISIAQAERLYLASHGTYASVDQLQQDGAITFSGTNRRGYNYTAEISGGEHFRIVATPADPAKAGWPALAIDETMQIAQQ
jgi:hypothetical protein